MIVKYVVAYVSTGIAFALIDAVWLRTMAERLYRPEIGEMMAKDFRLGPAIIFYVLYIAGMLYFAVLPALQSGGWRAALVSGAVLGFLCYATYDLTNFATLRVWSLKVTIFDIVWGTVLTGTTAAIGTAVTQAIAAR